MAQAIGRVAPTFLSETNGNTRHAYLEKVPVLADNRTHPMPTSRINFDTVRKIGLRVFPNNLVVYRCLESSS